MNHTHEHPQKIQINRLIPSKLLQNIRVCVLNEDYPTSFPTDFKQQATDTRHSLTVHV